MTKQFLILLLAINYFILSAEGVYAARNISITSDKTNLEINDELVVNASTSGFTNGEKIYIKGAFFKDGSSNYFSLTKNNDEWIKNSVTSLNQREVTIGSWDNIIITKPDFNDNGFEGPGEYKFKLGYYYLTSSGNTSSVNWSSNQINININSAPTEIIKPTQTKATISTSGNSKIITPAKLNSPTPSKYSSNVSLSKTNEEFGKITRRNRSASEYAQIKPVTNTEIEKKVKVLGARDSKSFVPILFLSGVLFLLAGLTSFIIKILKNRGVL